MHEVIYQTELKIFSTLKTETVNFLETSVLTYQTTWCHIKIIVTHNIKFRRRLFSNRLSDCLP
jgi:hypothetical protein